MFTTRVEPQGFFTIFALIFTSAVILLSVSTSISIIHMQKAHRHRFLYYKVNFLAQSGLAYALEHWDFIPELNTPTTKQIAYAMAYNGFHLPQFDDDVYVFKTSSAVYSVVLGPNQSRIILVATFTISDGQVTLNDIQKL